ncbi:hypothetical protein DFH09DRAFT_118225 [Mycena vulgaris]|nr:hypothetical protein DFH09DRAFT_118225 [Mycena vulgaris]
MSRATHSTPSPQQPPRASASPRRPPTPARSSDSPSTRPSRVFTPRPLRTSSSDDDDNGTEQHDRAQGVILPCVCRAAYRLAAPALPFDATPPALIPHQREHPAPGPARQHQLADPPRTHRVDAQAPCDTAAPSRQHQCGDPSRPLPPSASARRGSSESTSSGSLPASPLRTRAPRVLSSGTLARACRRRTRSYLVLRLPHSSRPLPCSPCASARPLIMPPPNSHSRSYPQHGRMTSTHPAPRAPFLCASRALPAPLVAPLLALWRGCTPHP